MTISNLLVDGVFLGMLALWYLHADDIGYVLSLALLAVLKLLATVESDL